MPNVTLKHDRNCLRTRIPDVQSQPSRSMFLTALVERNLFRHNSSTVPKLYHSPIFTSNKIVQLRKKNDQQKPKKTTPFLPKPIKQESKKTNKPKFEKLFYERL